MSTHRPLSAPLIGFLLLVGETDVVAAIPRQTARVLPINQSGQVLLLLGYDPARPDAPYWFTIGGAVEPSLGAGSGRAASAAEPGGP